MHLYHCNQLPSPFSNIFSYFSGQSEHFTRGATAGSMQLPLYRTVKSQRSFKFQGAKFETVYLNRLKT